MRSKPQLKIKIIAAIQFATAGTMILFSLACYSLPESEARQVQEFFSALPYFRNLPLHFDPWTAFVDLVLGFWGILKGIGILRMWGWVRTLILIDLAIWAGDLFMFGAISDGVTSNHLLASPDVLTNLTVNLFVLAYLMDPTVKESFSRNRHKA
jgi:hypothetical protein